MTYLKKRKPGRGDGRPSDITNTFRDAVTTRAIELRMESYTLRETAGIVNEEFGDTLSIETVRKWIEDRIKPELEEKADAYRQHLLDQIAVAKRALSKRVMMGDEKAVGAWTRLLDREMRLTGVEKPHQVHVTTSSADGDALDVQKQLDQFFGTAPAGTGHVIQGEVVRRDAE